MSGEMGNRGWDTRGKEGRRLRLWLKPSTWKLLEEKEAEKTWPSDDNSSIEMILDAWADAQLDRASSAIPIGPVELGMGAVSRPKVYYDAQGREHEDGDVSS